MSDHSQRTEPATPRKIQKAREGGQFPVSRHFVAGVQFVVFTALLTAFAGVWFAQLRASTSRLLRRGMVGTLEPVDWIAFAREALAPLAVAGGLLVVSTLAAQLAATRMGLSWKKLTPEWKRMSPMARLRELPRQNLSALAESVILLPLVVALVYLAARDKLPAYLALPMKSVPAAVAEVAAGVGGLLWKGAALFLVFGLVDLMRQRRRYARDLRMSRQEIRDELKEMEGDPHIKARIRALRRDLLRRRMMGEVPKATAVVVNPTHYAVALRYQMNSTSAPTVVAKGKNYLALRIRQKALEHEVPLVENPPLAQALYHTTQVGQEIPAQLFRAVAEVLAYVYRVMQGRLPG